MTDLRTAAQQAIALICSARLCEINSMSSRQEMLRLMIEATDTLRAALVEPVQEPVAWRTFDGEGGYDYRTYEDNESYAAEWEKRNPRHVGWVEPLYTAPRPAEPVQEPVACSNTFACRCPKHYTAEPVQEPQRKPLTVEEIADAAKSVPAAVYELMHGHEISVGKFRAALAEFARAIERAHNIKE